jgi:hypothetical protein
MSPRLLFAYLTLSLLEPLLALAKPPDLPVDLQAYYQNVVKQRQQAQAPRQSPLLPPAKELEADAQEAQEMWDEDCPCLDASCLEFVGVLGKIIQVIGQDQGDAVETEVLEVMPREAQTPAKAEKLSLSPRHRQARQLFRIAERCRYRGDLDMACNCYEEVRRIAPKSTYGLMASAQLERIKEQQALQQTGDSESQEPPVTDPTGDDEEAALIEELNRLADQLRKQSHAEPVCPFRRQEFPGCPQSRPERPDKPQADGDQSMSEAEMQEMLDDAQFLETFLDDLVVPEEEDGVYADIIVEVTNQPAESLLFGAGINANAGIEVPTGISRPEVLTVSPAPRDLTIVEEPQRNPNPPNSRGHRFPGVKQRFPSPRVNTPGRFEP